MAYTSKVDNTQTFLSAFNKQMSANLLGAVMAWHGAAVDELGAAGGARTGRVYRVPGTRRFYTASAKGQAPAVRLGDLRQSMQYRVEKSEALVGSPLEKALFLEKGTRRMGARPFLQPAYDKNRDSIQAELSAGIKGWH